MCYLHNVSFNRKLHLIVGFFVNVFSMEIVQSSDEAMLIIISNDEAMSYLEWTPDSDTIVYYPFTSETTINDMKESWTKYNLTNRNVVFWTYQWADCAYINPSNYTVWMYYSWTQIIPRWDFTWFGRLYQIWTSSANPRICSSYSWSPYWILINSSWTMVVWSSSNSNWFNVITWERHLYAVVGNCSTWSYKWYIDWELVKEWSWSWFTIWAWLTIWWHDSQGWASWTVDKFNWYMWRFWLENWQKSAAYIKDFFDKTKRYYWK